jgi:hypothetical protein
MSLDFMNSSHAKRAYEIVVGRKIDRLRKKKEYVLSGGVDDVALNSGQGISPCSFLYMAIFNICGNSFIPGPEAHLIPQGFTISPTIPELSHAFDGELIMILWDLDMNDGTGDPILGWFQAKVHR